MDMDLAEKPRNGRTKRVYQCRHCQRHFKRSEHCARHERVHTQERPFPCGFCERRYARKDLVKRHERSLHAEAYQAAHPEEFRRSSFQEIGQTHPVESTGSSSTTRNPTTPMTPPNDTVVVDFGGQGNGCAPDNFFNVGQVFTHEVQSPLGQFSPPASLHEQDRRASMYGTLALNPSQSICDPIVDFSPMELWSPSQEFHTDAHSMESPAKRRRIEIDPLLLLDTDAQSTQLRHDSVALPLSNKFSPDANNVFYAASRTLPTGGIPSLPFSDIYNEDALLPWFAEDFLSETPRHLPQQHSPVQKDNCFELPEFKFTDEIRNKVCEDARTRLRTGELVEALFPSVDDLNQFFSGYMQCFHRHFPILHLSSLDIRETPSPLIFGICSIGAQYRLARQKAKNLFALAGTMSSYALRAGLPIKTGTPQPGPLWIMQTRVLLSLCGMFSGKTNVVMRTVENLGLFAIDYRLRKALLSTTADEQLDWEDWISRESSKRLLCGMFIVSNLISTTFGVSPGFDHTTDLEFEVLDEERLWNSKTSHEWMELRTTQTPTTRSTVRDTMARIIFDDDSTTINQPIHISGFTMLVMMHAVNIHIWNSLQCSLTNPRIRDTILEAALDTLSRCEEIIISVRGREDCAHTWTESEGPIMFNCQGLLRIAYIRLFSNTSAFDRLTLLTDNPEDVSIAVKRYAESPQKRNRNLMTSVMKAFEMLLATVKIGYLLLRKTAALSWSIEHAIAGWDAALFLTKWVHAIEVEALIVPPDAEESHVLEELKNLLTEAGSDFDASGSLAAQLAHFSSSTLNDCWVWGVTPRMGNILQQLAFAYEKDYQNLVSIESQIH